MNVKVGRNDPCPCGSGKKYKKCCSEKNQIGNPGLNTLAPGTLPIPVAAKHLSAKSNNAEAHYDLGNSLIALGQFENAAVSYRLALKIKPDFVEAHYNLANALKDSGQLEAAAVSFRRVIALRPDLVDAHFNLGNVHKDLRQFKDAESCYRQALKLQPGDIEALNNLGISLQNLFRFDEAMACYLKALATKPDFAEVHNNLGNTYRDTGQIDQAIASFQHALQIRRDYFEAHSNLLYSLNFSSRHTPSFNLEQSLEFGRIASLKSALRFTTWQCSVQPEKLRVGLVSGDLRKHSVGYFLEAVLAQIDPARIELCAYPTHPREDELTARMRPCFLIWKSLVGKSDEEAAGLIHADGVHILIDLSGHTAHNRLPVFACKPAPVQVTWLGLPATTGLAEMDYILGDFFAIPDGLQQHFTEAVWCLPEIYLCLTVPAYPSEVAPLPALATKQVTFGSFNNLTKMNDDVVAVWARILKSVPNSRLLLKTMQLSDPALCERTCQRFATQGISSDRLILIGILPAINDHLAMYNKVDIALDTFPYPGVTTSVEALWMGVPVLSLLGNTFLSCTAASIAHNASMPDWVAADEEDYVAKAIAFTSNLKRLGNLRSGLRQQVLASPLFDAPRFARNFEGALRGMWEARGRE